MTNADEIIGRGWIDIADDINFRTHSDVLRLFGRDTKVFQKALAKHPHEADVRIWFPMFYDDSNNDWENTFSQNEERVFERRKFDNDEYLNGQLNEAVHPKRILFAKVDKFGTVFYQFKGVYLFDAELSRKAKKTAYKRLATIAKLYPTS